MEILLWLIIFAFLVNIIYSRNIESKDRIMLIRDLTIALKSKNLQEYTEAIPEDIKEQTESIKDELVPLSEIEPEVLLKAL